MMEEVCTRLRKLDKFQEILSLRVRRAGALRGGSWIAVLSALRAEGKSLLIILPDAESALEAYEDLALLLGEEVLLFPPWDIFPPEEKVPGPVLGDRLRVLERIGESARIVVSPIQALLQPLWSRERVSSSKLVLQKGQTLEIDSLLARLVHEGFERVHFIDLPGEFSLRGGILDLFPPSSPLPYRIELLDDVIESIRVFSVETQRSVEEFDHCTLLLLNRPLPDEDGGESLLTYLSSDFLIILRDPALIQDAGQRYYETAESRSRLFSPETIFSRLNSLPHLSLHSEPVLERLGGVNFSTSAVTQFTGETENIFRELVELVREVELIVVFSRNPFEESRLKEVLEPSGLLESPKFQFRIGFLNHGFIFRELGVAYITHHEIFSRLRARRGRARPRAEPIPVLHQLRRGDYVVHLNHGIGRFRGLETLERDGRTEEFLVIEFAEKTRLYVPVAQANLVQKYIAPTHLKPPLSKLGTSVWQRRKKQAEEAVREYAQELLRIQALRQQSPGIKHLPDTDWQREFEGSFPYEETEDQLRATEEVKRDLESSHPSDRLLCGDVGYGKTEVCMRAAFKAVLSGYQVAVLVPTTVLAEQHYNTFRERMRAYPVVIEMLSRFRTLSQQKAILESTRLGKIDILIGTHRLLSDDVSFKNLGLLIIDEEHRFGVRAKEKLKKLRHYVDVLTLTATPIPRTLHMSLLGIRDISVLATPPQDRLSVVTEVTTFNLRVIREGILRELQRGGQVFFVHNRIYDIQRVSSLLKKTVPSATYTVVHGQMKPGVLEERMRRFVRGEVDVLISTNIIESGLDIPRANTIFVNNAHLFGLADMHQLRGRVGRYKHRAFAYFLIPPGRDIPPQALRRLRAIEELSELGSGFFIATRDLEIRGAGNIIGTEQHGHILEVGYELYCKLLHDAIRQLNDQPTLDLPETEIELPLSSYIPSSYIKDPLQKVELYRRLALAGELSELDGLYSECTDRFGRPPVEVRNLFLKHRLRVLLQRARVTHLRFRGGAFRLKLLDPRSLPPQLIERGVVTSSVIKVPVFDEKPIDEVVEELIALLGGSSFPR